MKRAKKRKETDQEQTGNAQRIERKSTKKGKEMS